MSCFPMRDGKYNLEDVNMQFGEPEFYEWLKMLSRCEDPFDPDFPKYGGRGIQVCERWHNYNNFLEDMGPMPDQTIQ